MQFDFNLGAGASQTIDVKGRFFKYKSGTGLIRVRTSLGGFVDVLPGQGIENVHFTSLTISDRSNADNAGSILAGDFDFRDDRITGTVEVVDGGKNRTLAGIAFMGAINGPGTAGNSINFQLWNPVDSNRRAVVGAMTVGSGVNNGFRCLISGTQLATFHAPGASKNVGGALPVAHLRRELSPGQLGDNSLMVEFIQASQPFIFKFTEPVVLSPGTGINVASGQYNVDMAVSFEWYEEAI